MWTGGEGVPKSRKFCGRHISIAPKVFAPSLSATSSKVKRTVSDSSDKTTENRTESDDRVSERVQQPETVVPEPIVESGPVELAAAEEEEEAAQEQCRAWVIMTHII